MLSTAPYVSFLADIALFGVVVGISLLLAGIGFLILALGGALRRVTAEVKAPAATPQWR